MATTKQNTIDEKAKMEFEKSLELRNFEISMFWKRGWFFGALILATISGYAMNIDLGNPIVPPICISFLILLFSLAQTLMNRGSKYWQERWEYKTKNRETKLGVDVTLTEKYKNSERYYIDKCIIEKDENIFARSQRISVSKLTFLIWDIICISSFLFWTNDLFELFDWNICGCLKIVLFHIFILVYIVCFLYKWRGWENIKKTKKGELKERERYIHDKIE